MRDMLRARAAARSARAGGRAARDAGLTLIELLVSMGIFSVVVVVFMGGLVSMTRSTTRTEQVTDAGDATRRTFQTMDKQIRYASSINFPGVGPSGAHYVEFLTTARPDGAPPLCTQWRMDPTARVIQSRTWPDVVGGTRTPWRTVATDVRNVLSGPGAAPPFVLKPVAGTSVRQQLVVTVDVGRGDAATGSATGADIRTVFVARNSSYLSPSNVPDATGQSITKICNGLWERP